MVKRKEKPRAPLEVLQPGERSEFWENVLRHRDANDSAWRLFSPAMKYAAECYERNRDALVEKIAA
jgi:hypothetical protein